MPIPEITIIQEDDSNKRVWDLDVPIIQDKNSNKIKVYLNGAIEEPSIYNELCYLLQEAGKKDEIHIYLNTPGGVVDSAIMIANAIRNSKAKIIGHLSGTVASAGTLISMACTELKVEEHLAFMIHNYSGTMGGKGNEMKARQQFMDKSITKAFKDYYKDFLSENEINEVVEGKDIWLDTKDVVKRWNTKLNYLKGKA